MRKLMIAAAAAGFALSPALSPAMASELQGHCEAYAAENGTDASGCSCLAEIADADATAELMAVTSEADLEALSDNAKGAIQACFPDA